MLLMFVARRNCILGDSDDGQERREGRGRGGGMLAWGLLGIGLLVLELDAFFRIVVRSHRILDMSFIMHRVLETFRPHQLLALKCKRYRDTARIPGSNSAPLFPPSPAPFATQKPDS